MTHLKDMPFSELQFYATSPYPCSYLEQHTARSQVATPVQLIDKNVYSILIKQGFRRSGMFVYRPYCDQCHACLPTRVLTEQFTPNRSQRRAWKAHQHLIALVKPIAYSDEHFALYQQYQSTRHVGGGMDQDTSEQYTDFLLQSSIHTHLVEFREQNGQLSMVSIIDEVNDGLSSVYTFFDTSVPHAAFGTYNILWQIAQAKSLQLPYVYLGYWIKECHKMTYKSHYRPLEILHQRQWKPIENIIDHI